jgi:hypothetical protein
VLGDALQIAPLVATAVAAGMLASRMRTQRGEAEDPAEVPSFSESVNVPAGSFDHCLKTKETEAIDPEALEHKFYAAGVGNVLTLDLVTGENLPLVQIKTQ